MKPDVQYAIEEIRAAFPDADLLIEGDPDGGAFVTASDFDIGAQFEPSRSWCGFHITFQYPFADIYPHYFVPNLCRKDGKPLGEAIHINNQWQHPAKVDPATMVSRRSNKRDAATESAAIKLSKVLSWLRSR